MSIPAKLGFVFAGLVLLYAVIRGVMWATPRVWAKVRTLRVWHRTPRHRTPRAPRPVIALDLRRDTAKRRLRKWGFIIALLLTGPRLFHQIAESHAYNFIPWIPLRLASCALAALLIESMWVSAILGWDDQQRWRGAVSFGLYVAATGLIQLLGAPKEVILALPVFAAVWNGMTLDLSKDTRAVGEGAHPEASSPMPPDAWEMSDGSPTTAQRLSGGGDPHLLPPPPSHRAAGDVPTPHPGGSPQGVRGGVRGGPAGGAGAGVPGMATRGGGTQGAAGVSTPEALQQILSEGGDLRALTPATLHPQVEAIVGHEVSRKTVEGALYKARKQAPSNGGVSVR